MPPHAPCGQPAATLALLDRKGPIAVTHVFSGPLERRNGVGHFSLPTFWLDRNKHLINVGVNECMRQEEIHYVWEPCSQTPGRVSWERFIMARFRPGTELQHIWALQWKPGLTPLSFYILRPVEFAHSFFPVRHFAHN